MGLDVYMYYSKNWDTSIQNEDDYNDAVEALFEELRVKYNIPDGEYVWQHPEGKVELEAEEADLKAKYGIDGYSPDTIESISLDDAEYPEHMFKIGYFRSSYNPSGINHVLKDRIGVDLYDLFTVANGDGGYSDIDWWASLENINQAIDTFVEYLDKEISNYFVVECDTRNIFSGQDPVDDKGNIHYAISKSQALTIFEQAMTKERISSTGYSNLIGEWFPGGAEVHAILKGRSVFGGECSFAIIKKKEEDEGLSWYLQALEICKHTCEWVLSKPDPENYRLSWSG